MVHVLPRKDLEHAKYKKFSPKQHAGLDDGLDPILKSKLASDNV